MSKYIVVTVNYNNSEFTDYFIQSLYNFNNWIRELIIVDNGSNSKEKETLESIVKFHSNKEKNKIKLINLENNIGYFAGLNYGLSLLEKKERVIVCNNDILFNYDFFKIIDNTYIENDIMILSPRVTTIDGIEQNPNLAKQISKYTLLKYKVLFSNYYIFSILFGLRKRLLRSNHKDISIGQKKIWSGIGAIYILTENFFKAFSSLPQETYLWGEENILSYHIHKRKGNILFVPEAKVIHFENQAVKKLPSKYSFKIKKESFKKYVGYYCDGWTD